MSCLESGAPLGVLLAPCGLRTPQPTPPLLYQTTLRPVPRSAVERKTRWAPDLHFDLNSHVLRISELRKLAQIAPVLQDILHDFPELIIVIEGHSSDRGLHDYNHQLGLARADAVRRVLLNLSFPEDRVRTVSLGDSALQCLEPDEGCRQKNRRVHFRTEQALSGTAGGVGD